jgi:hypothetical protein
MKARVWLPLVLGPSAAVAVEAALYTLVTPSCGAQTRLELHLAAAVALAVVVVLGIVAFSEASLHRGEPQPPDAAQAGAALRGRRLAKLATALCTLAAVAIVATWLTFWLLSPCRP